MVAIATPASWPSARKLVIRTAIPCKPQSLGDSSRANAIVVAVCITNFKPCADTVAKTPRTDLCFRSLRGGCASKWYRSQRSLTTLSIYFVIECEMLAQSLALRVTGPRTAKDWGVENG